MKKTLKTLLLACPGFQALCRLLTRSHVRALMYHRFSDEATGDPRFLDRATLDLQMAYIRRHHAVWAPDDHVAAVGEGPRPAGACPVVVTIDDGYRDVFDLAYPLFARHRIPAMLFITSGFVDGTHWMWWDRVAWVIDAAAPVRREFHIGRTACELDLESPAGRQTAWNRVADICRFLPDGRKQEVIAELAADLDVELKVEPPDQYAAASWDQVRGMVAGGMLMGAHTVSHPILSRLDTDRAAAEIEDSQQRLTDELDLQPNWFAYPQGGPADYTAETREIVARRFDGCYIAWQDLAAADDPYTLPRYCISPDMNDFRWMLCGAEYLGLRLRAALGLDTGLGEFYWTGAEDAVEEK
ncbi:MAG: polysaccharide deacetylase family protein [bacterium]|nr:polysaccharide deacetylase family protein [bacterium]